jgi:hypothetical protein
MNIDENNFSFTWTIAMTESDHINLRSETWTHFPSTLFARPELLWLLVLWNIEAQDEGPVIPDGQKPWQRSRKIRHSKISSPSSSILWNTLIMLLNTRESIILNSNKRSFESLPQGKIRQVVATFWTSYIVIASIEKSIDYSFSFSKTNISVLTNLIVERERVKSTFKKAFNNAKRLLVIESSCHTNIAA